MKPRRVSSASRTVESSQTDVHPDLSALVDRYLQHTWQAPIAEHSAEAFEQAQNWIASHQNKTQYMGIILDSGCGVGQSTAWLAKQYPEHLVIGLDRSEDRLSRQPELVSNAYLLRADVTSFWRLAVQADWQLARHTIFYPNPYPKPKHVQRRWHAHPVFPFILKLGGVLECRSNWKLYLQELEAALAIIGIGSSIVELKPSAESNAAPVTLFEAKYQASGQQCWQLVADLDQRVI